MWKFVGGKQGRYYTKDGMARECQIAVMVLVWMYTPRNRNIRNMSFTFSEKKN